VQSADDFLEKLREEIVAARPSTWGETARLIGRRRITKFATPDLLGTVALCAGLGIPIPPRTGLFFLLTYLSRPKSWDAVFGPPRQKGKSAEASARQMQLAVRLLEDKERHAHPVGDMLFMELGKRHRASSASAKRAYYFTNADPGWFVPFLFAQALKEDDHEDVSDVEEAAGALWLQRIVARLARKFSKSPKRLRNARSARNRRASQKSAKD
jgi:hypothetical protein